MRAQLQRLMLGGLLLVQGASVGLMFPGYEPHWAAVPRIPVIGYCAIVFSAVDMVRYIGHDIKLWISRGIRASEVQDDPH